MKRLDPSGCSPKAAGQAAGRGGQMRHSSATDSSSANGMNKSLLVLIPIAACLTGCAHERTLELSKQESKEIARAVQEQTFQRVVSLGLLSSSNAWAETA